jgi:AcrR family transcriptional regulator
MGVAERRLREKTELREEILAAARKIFMQEGFEALTMRRVADEIEYSPTTIYLHFKDKSELVRAICDELFGGLVKRLEELGKKHTDPLEYMEAGLRAYIGLKNPSNYYVTFIAAAGRVDYEFKGSAGEKAFGFLRHCIGAAIEAGRIRKVDVDATAQTLWMATHGLVSLLITDRHFPFVGKQRLIDQLMDTLVRGLQETPA